ncbi:aldehyde dehydrogenase family protein [Rhodococcus pyridinivorans]|uniref:aldehyde dehydrogenase family protein n=1 Tax=Rhodococcus pyridinivorans TaxID=103816 RepID=UPI002227ED7F|nr:aldehyde dehydrogenase family protein [Rhodococcus pyridinivorans]MCW3472714.1 aldehyde dehydrogenase family protein [Rhodococcus pyridinivorans]
MTLSQQIVPDTDPGELVAGVRAIHASGRTRSLEWRLKQLDGLSRLVKERESDFAEALAADLGRSPSETWLGDLAGTAGEIDYARKHLKGWMKRRKESLPMAQRPGSAWVQYEPVGTVLIIGPWNYPVFLTLSPLVAAVAAGNCAIVKPSELAPATAGALARLIPEYLDPDAVKVVQGDGRTTQNLIDQGFDHILFTGGTEVGRKIMAGAAKTLTPVTLELGGKSPVIVAADADLAVAARRIAWVKLMNSGQTCIAPDYVLVDETVKDEFVDLLRAELTTMQGDEAAAGQRIVNEGHFDRLAASITSTRGVIVHGGQSERAALTMQATVIVDPDPDEPVMADEIFGPILPVLPFATANEAIRFVSARPKPLALYVFSKSSRTSDAYVSAIQSGGAVVNHVAMHCLVPALPFGGIGDSGIGSYHGRWGFETLSHRRAVLKKGTWPDPSLMYPPYSDRALKLMRKVL